MTGSMLSALRPLLAAFVVFVVAAPVWAGRAVLVVNDLVPKGVNEKEAQTVTELLRGRLVQARRFTVVERSQMEALAKEVQVQISGCTDVSCAVQLGQMLNADKIVVGSVSEFLGKILVTARIVDLERSSVVCEESASAAADPDELERAVNDLGDRLSSHVPLVVTVKAVKGDDYYLDAGQADGMKEGRRLVMLREEVVGDETGRPLLRSEEEVGELEVVGVFPEGGKARKNRGEVIPGDFARVAADGRVPGPAVRASASPASSPAPTAALEPPFADPATGMELVFVPGGTFEMGDTFGDGNADEKPVHTVTVSGFWLGRTEVTQAQWEQVMGANPSGFKGSGHPVERVSWDDAQEFLRRLNGQSGRAYRLPTEAEWEYAARSGGKKEKWAGTSDESELGDYAWTYGNSGLQTHPVGRRKPNDLGLYDMTGNVREWCGDWRGDYPSSSQTNPAGPPWGSDRVIRGGGWSGVTGRARVSHRGAFDPSGRFDTLGLRLALSPP